MTRVAGLLALVAIGCVPAFGSAIFTDGSYNEFTFGTAPGTVIGCGPANAQVCSATTNPVADRGSTSPWTFTGPAVLFVLDIGDIGDTFQVFDNLVSQGDTSATSGSGNPCGFDITCALANLGATGYSSGTFVFGAGSHSITIDLLTNAVGTAGGNAVFSLSAAVPEPATFGLIGISLAGLAFYRRRRR